MCKNRPSRKSRPWVAQGCTVCKWEGLGTRWASDLCLTSQSQRQEVGEEEGREIQALGTGLALWGTCSWCEWEAGSGMALLGAQLAPWPFAPASLGGVNLGSSASKHRPRKGSQEPLPDIDLFLKAFLGGEVFHTCTLHTLV